MTDLDTQVEVKESKAKIAVLENKINALVKILEKEGITTKEEVEESTKRIIDGEEDE
jgi:hypothetical protein